MVLAAVTEVGLTMTVVGAVTGSKDLMKIGGVLSLVGGVGGMIAGTGTAAAGEAAAGALSDSATDAALSAASDEAVAASMSDMAAGEALGQAQLAEVAQSGIISAPVAPQTNLIPTNLSPAGQMAKTMGTVTESPLTQQATDVNAVTTAADKSPLGVQEVAGAQAPVTPADANVNPTDMRLAANQQRTPDGGLLPKDDSGSFFGKFSEWATKNEKLFNGGMQLVGGALKGANDADMWDQKMALERDRWNRANSVGTFQPRGIVGGAA